MPALRGITSWLVAAGLVAPVACEDERARPNDMLEGGEGEGEGEPISPFSPFACGESTYECREGQECVEGICRTPEGEEEKWCKSITFLEWSKNFYLPVDLYLGDHGEEEGDFGGACVRSDFFDFTKLQMRSGVERPFLWGVYEGDSVIERYFNKAATIDQREGKAFEELRSSDFFRDNVCGGSNGIFFDANDRSKGWHFPWMRTTFSVLPEVGGQPTNFFAVRAAFFATESGETESMLLGTKIDDDQGGPIVLSDIWTKEGGGVGLDVAITGDISPSCEFLEIGAYHKRLSNHDIQNLRVYLQPSKSVGLSALEVWSCACDEEPQGDVVRPGNF